MIDHTTVPKYLEVFHVKRRSQELTLPRPGGTAAGKDPPSQHIQALDEEGLGVGVRVGLHHIANLGWVRYSQSHCLAQAEHPGRSAGQLSSEESGEALLLDMRHPPASDVLRTTDKTMH